MDFLKEKSGFSLVELAITVAIIGMLASIGINVYQDFLGKARQFEAKTALSAMYTAEATFYAEFSSYTDCLSAAGYSQSATQRYYMTGFWAGNSFSCGDGATSCYASSYRPYTYCDCDCPTYDATGINGATWANTVLANPSLQLANTCAFADPTGVIFNWGVSQHHYTAGAYGSVTATGGYDAWQIDELRNVQNVVNGL